MDKGSGSGIFPDPDPGDPKRPDPTGSGSGSASLLRSTSQRNSLKTHKTSYYDKFFEFFAYVMYDTPPPLAKYSTNSSLPRRGDNGLKEKKW